MYGEKEKRYDRSENFARSMGILAVFRRKEPTFLGPRTFIGIA
jgi:hypothetical protein